MRLKKQHKRQQHYVYILYRRRACETYVYPQPHYTTMVIAKNKTFREKKKVGLKTQNAYFN